MHTIYTQYAPNKALKAINIVALTEDEKNAYDAICNKPTIKHTTEDEINGNESKFNAMIAKAGKGIETDGDKTVITNTEHFPTLMIRRGTREFITDIIRSVSDEHVKEGLCIITRAIRGVSEIGSVTRPADTYVNISDERGLFYGDIDSEPMKYVISVPVEKVTEEKPKGK